MDRDSILAQGGISTVENLGKRDSQCFLVARKAARLNRGRILARQVRGVWDPGSVASRQGRSLGKASKIG